MHPPFVVLFGCGNADAVEESVALRAWGAFDRGCGVLVVTGAESCLGVVESGVLGVSLFSSLLAEFAACGSSVAFWHGVVSVTVGAAHR